MMTPQKMRELIAEFAVHGHNQAERLLGCDLASYTNSLPDNELIDFVRNKTEEMEDALNEFTRQWMKINGE